MLEGLFSYYMEHPEELSDEFKAMLASGRDPLEIVVCDYISGFSGVLTGNRDTDPKAFREEGAFISLPASASSTLRRQTDHFPKAPDTLCGALPRNRYWADLS